LVFGEVVRGHRRRLGLTQEELAAKAGMSGRHVRHIEAGRIGCPRPTTVRLLADAFRLSGAERDRFVESAAADGDPTPVDGSGRRPVPAQLPLDVRGFSGRSDELKRLDHVLATTAGEQPTAVVISAVWGTAGVGKTALAVHWAHRVADRFPDGQLYVNLRGFDPGASVEPAEAMRGFLEALGVAPQAIPAELAGQAAMYRSTLAGRRMLVVLDNARDADQVRPLLPGAPGCLVLVTSRNRLSGLVASEGAYPIDLDLLSTDEAREFLARRIGPDRTAAEAAAVDDIASCCARLPLALAIVAARAVSHPNFPLATVAADLRASRGGLDAFAGSDAAIDARAVFSWSYRTLNPEAARLFRLLGLFPGPDIGIRTAASLAGVPRGAVRPLLSELTRAHLLIEHSPGRYTFHDLLRAYAAELVRTVDDADERHHATTRMLDHYLHTAVAAATLMRPSRDPVPTTVLSPGVYPEELIDANHALSWFATERVGLVAAIRKAADAGYLHHTLWLARSVEDLLDRHGYWQELLTTQRTALDAAERNADRAGQGDVHRGLARADFRSGRYDDAQAHLERALASYREVGDTAGLAYVHLNMGSLAEAQPGREPAALRCTERALELFLSIDHEFGQSAALGHLAWQHALSGQHEEAIRYGREALELHRRIDDWPQEAHTWDTIGYAYHHLRGYRQAVDCFEQALTVHERTGDLFSRATVLTHLGDTHHAAGGNNAARVAWQQALALFERLRHPNAEKVRAKLEGDDRVR